ncbi:hypothetical protein L1D46_15585 [Pseudoalteromonas sp. Isolate3]|uniref:hypothetical protein n=1 Tax=Pseudoalteromonas sp. Isolate3 TaxID=2908526 RepID=UPI001EFD0879|nr:hypothetical protein [Pseudoalteromonas sp. Isolate3]MCG9710217.1 hypothetical protein [Pseudoalteromonas sp. Isolate3]
MFKNKFGMLIGLALVTCSVFAQEPLRDRAIIQYMSADILLPDNSLLNVDMSFDCGSDFSETAMIITSDAGAHLLATAFSTLYGANVGEQILKSWNNKVHESDPRKPTFLVVTPPDNAQKNWYESGIAKSTNKAVNYSTNSLTSVNKSDADDSSNIPIVRAYCGSRDHIATTAQ